MIHCDIEQGSHEWFQLRAGKITGSVLDDLFDRYKTNAKDGSYKAGDATKTATKVMRCLAMERITGEPTRKRRFETRPMAHGKEFEAEALQYYCDTNNVSVVQPAFIDHLIIKYFGFSPDAASDDFSFCVEVKCPETETFLSRMLDGDDGAYKNQALTSLACLPTALYCDRIDYDPYMPEGQRMLVQRYWRADHVKEILELEAKVIEANLMIDEIQEQIMNFEAKL